MDEVKLGALEGRCCFNKMVDCTCASAGCGHCGWNPDVSTQRVEEWHERRAQAGMVARTVA